MWPADFHEAIQQFNKRRSALLVFPQHPSKLGQVAFHDTNNEINGERFLLVATCPRCPDNLANA